MHRGMKDAAPRLQVFDVETMWLVSLRFLCVQKILKYLFALNGLFYPRDELEKTWGSVIKSVKQIRLGVISRKSHEKT